MSADGHTLEVTKSAVHRRLALGSRAYLWLLPGLALALVSPAGLRIAIVIAYDSFLVLLFGLEALRLMQHEVLAARQLDTRLRALVTSTYRIHLQNPSASRLRLRVRDSAPPEIESEPAEHALVLEPHAQSVVEHTLYPLRRGRMAFEDLHVRLESRFGLAAVTLRVPAHQEVRVVPDATLERSSAAAGPRRELGEVALRIQRASQGSELESLREYVASDPLRAIDWKATAKRMHPVTRLYQPERSQTLWLVLDTSRTMAAAIGEARASVRGHKTRCDVAIEALLVLADGALRAGDQVGVLVHGDGLRLLVPPARGRSQFRRLADALVDVHAASVPLDVRGLVAELERRARKRALVVLFTDLGNETHGEALYEHARMLTRRHLALFVSLDDSITRTNAELAPRSDEDVFHRAAAIDLLRERTELTHRLQKRGVLVLEADERGLARLTLERYLEVKTHARL